MNNLKPTSTLVLELNDQIDEISLVDDNAERFIIDLMMDLETGRDFEENPLSLRQESWLRDIYEKYCSDSNER